MQLEDYFDFLAPDDIRIRGTRVGIESILYEYIHRRRSPEEIAGRFQTVSLEQVYATILYYLRHGETVTAYLEDWLDFSRKAREEQQRTPSAVTVKMRQLKEERRAAAEMEPAQAE